MTETLKVDLFNSEKYLGDLDAIFERTVEKRLKKRQQEAGARMSRMVKESARFVYPENVATHVSKAIADPVTSNFAVDEEGNLSG